MWRAAGALRALTRRWNCGPLPGNSGAQMLPRADIHTPGQRPNPNASWSMPTQRRTQATTCHVPSQWHVHTRSLRRSKPCLIDHGSCAPCRLIPSAPFCADGRTPTRPHCNSQEKTCATCVALANLALREPPLINAYNALGHITVPQRLPRLHIGRRVFQSSPIFAY